MIKIWQVFFANFLSFISSFISVTEGFLLLNFTESSVQKELRTDAAIN